jgi:adenine-specific DNA-methyltransferase
VLAREDAARDLFADPQLDYAKAVQFYQHDVDWANRMILGDSLQVMASLARREDLAGKVQMIYLDPPYGIKFASNFQPQLGQRDVKDREQDLTREPEMVKAYRDTWTLGIHSYLAYLRDRLAIARELLADSGSIFVQISDENLHRVRCVMDEVFKPENFVSLITVWKTSSATSNLLATTSDYILWYGKDISRAKFRPVFTEKEPDEPSSGGAEYKFVHLQTGEMRPVGKCQDVDLEEGRRYRPSPTTSQSGSATTRIAFELQGKIFEPGVGGWKSNSEGLKRLGRAGRLIPRDKSISFVRYLNDFKVTPVAFALCD